MVLRPARSHTRHFWLLRTSHTQTIRHAPRSSATRPPGAFADRHSRVLDAFHVVRLGLGALDQVRRRVQRDTLGSRGHRDDPLFRIRRLLRRGYLRLLVVNARSESQRRCPNIALAWRRPQPDQGVGRMQ